MSLNFIAAEDGLEQNPKVQTLAKLLKERRRDAFWYVMMWRRLIVHEGNASGCLPRHFTAADVAAFLDFPGEARRLVGAMKATGFLAYRKGRGFHYPGWSTTTTGSYVTKRHSDRQRKAAERAAARAHGRASGDVPGQSADASTDRARTSSQDPTERKEPRGAAAPPRSPPDGGASSADARWDHLMKVAPTPQNREVCKRLLGAMPPEDWELVQASYARLKTDSLTLSKKNRRVLHWPTDQFIRKQAYLRFRPAERPTVTAVRIVKPAGPDPAVEEKHRHADAFLALLVADPDIPEADKKRHRDRWLADPDNHGRPPPWAEAGPK